MSVQQPVNNEKSLRNNAKEISLQESDLRTRLGQQRLQYIWLAASITAVLFLGVAMIVGVWANYRWPFTIVGFAASAASTAGAAYQILKLRPVLAGKTQDLLHLQTDKAHLAATNEADDLQSLRIYRVNAQVDIDQYQGTARKNRRTANILQWLIIVGSVLAASTTSASAASLVGTNWFRWVAAGMSLVVAVASAGAGFFKFRERGSNQQQTADAIRKHHQAIMLGIGDYAEGEEIEKLRKFARNVEELKDEQRKRELQLEESSNERTQQS